MNEFWVFWWNAPIAVGIAGDDSVSSEALHVIHPVFCALVMPLHDGIIGILLAKRLRNNYGTARPGNIVRIDRPIGGAHIRHTAGVALRVSHVLQPFRV